MKKKAKPTKEKVKNLLWPFIPFTSKKLIEAFRTLISKYCEIIPYRKFTEIAMGKKDVDGIAEQIVKDGYKYTRKEREDKKRKSDKCKGRKRDKVWDVLKEAEDILLLKYRDQWKVLGANNGEQWAELCFKLSEAYLKEIPITDFPVFFSGYSAKAVLRMMDEQFALNGVIDVLKNEVAKALKNNSRNNKTFLNTVKEIWGEDVSFLSNDNMQIKRQRGQKISREQINRRSQRIREIILSGKNKNFTSGRDYLDLKTRLCQMAHHIYFLLVRFHRWPLELKKKRLEAILRIKTLMREYSIHPVELFDEKDIHQLKGMITSPKGFGVGKLITPTNASQ